MNVPYWRQSANTRNYGLDNGGKICYNYFCSRELCHFYAACSLAFAVITIFKSIFSQQHLAGHCLRDFILLSQEVRISLKKLIRDFFGHFFSNPLLPLLVVIGSVSVMLFTGDDHSERMNSDVPEYVRTSVPLVVTTSTEPDTSASSSADSTSNSSAAAATVTTAAPMTVASFTSETTTTTATAAPVTDDETTSADETSTEAAENDKPDDTPRERPQVSNYTVYVGADSPNSGYYQERLVIFGDSIAYGFNAYGYIPREHNVAAESMALWNLSKYSFDLGGGSMNPVDAAVYSDSPLIYISIGMNDILGIAPDSYANTVCTIAQQFVDSIPDVTVVIGSITPVSANNYYTTNDRIDSFNNAARNTVDAFGSEQILFFDANAVLKDPNTGALAGSISGGDGLHISGAAYGYWLNALFSFLDANDVTPRIEAHDSKYE
jgi:lysophospholipase L1-like esterase